MRSCLGRASPVVLSRAKGRSGARPLQVEVRIRRHSAGRSQPDAHSTRASDAHPPRPTRRSQPNATTARHANPPVATRRTFDTRIRRPPAALARFLCRGRASTGPRGGAGRLPSRYDRHLAHRSGMAREADPEQYAVLREAATERPSPGPTPTPRIPASTAAPGAAPSSSAPRPSSTRAPAGRASSSRHHSKASRCAPTRHTGWSGGSAVQGLRRPSRPRLRRRPEPDRPALLHQLLRA